MMYGPIGHTHTVTHGHTRSHTVTHGHTRSHTVTHTHLLPRNRLQTEKQNRTTEKQNNSFITDSLQLSVSEEEVPPEQQHCEQEWSPSLGQKDPETKQIKEEQEEVRTNQEEEQLQGVEPDIIDLDFTPPCVKSECDLEDPLWSLTLPQTKTVENRESD
uniref:Uncharacterized protein n=1 Tax=Oncorhynchus tshawytscha TaxID=74940 RepID=A0AAZ3PCW7_ONCTS